jgi:aldehyde dehydrogenase (NAD+)
MVRPVTADLSRQELYIDGLWPPPVEGETLPVTSPVTEQAIGSAQRAGVKDIDRAVDAARRAFDSGEWPRTAPAERGQLLAAVCARYQQLAEEMALTITAEMGSPITLARSAQVGGAVFPLQYYADMVASYPFRELRRAAFGAALVERDPVGVVAAIVPWNFPQATLMTKLAAALAAGCTVVVKPAPETPVDAGEHLVAHPGVDKVSFTGSTAAGRLIGALCADGVRRCTLELGGKSAALILDDADLPSTLAGLRQASLMNSGQTHPGAASALPRSGRRAVRSLRGLGGGRSRRSGNGGRAAGQ